MTAEPIHLLRAGPVAELVFNRPEKRNAISEAMLRRIPGLLGEAAKGDSIRTLIVRGEGDAFAAGADIGEFAAIRAAEGGAERFGDAVRAAMHAIASFPVPTIAMVRGAAVGGGCGLAIACDLRFADAGARFGVTPGKLGLLYTLEDTKRLIGIVGVSAARDLMFTARLIGAEEALAIGLADRVFAPGALEPETRAYADMIAACSPGSVRDTKAVIALILAGAAFDTDETERLFAEAVRSDDAQEGFRAFLEKRRPVFGARGE